MGESTDRKEEQRRPQLHEVLAVDRELEKKDQEERGSAMALFTGRPELFQGFIKTLLMFKEDDKVEEAAHAETMRIYLQVDQVLEQALQHTIRYMDALAQKERTNQAARADLILDNGDVLLRDVPVTTLLALERIVADTIKLYGTIPVLAAGIEWDPDSNLGEGVYKAKPDIKRLKTKTVQKPIVLHEATDRHPAQVQLISDTIPVGEYTDQRWSSLMVPRRKMTLLARLEELQRAVKQARMRANTTQIVPVSIGKILVDWINQE